MGFSETETMSMLLVAIPVPMDTNVSPGDILNSSLDDPICTFGRRR